MPCTQLFSIKGGDNSLNTMEAPYAPGVSEKELRTMKTDISYGKEEITFYRTYARPQCGIRPIPESPFTGKKHTLFALKIGMEVFGNSFLPAYTEGDNRNVIATDSMKNFVLQQALAFSGSTLESFLAFLGQQFLSAYPQVDTLQLTGTEQPFLAISVPQEDCLAFVDSPVLFTQSHNDYFSAFMRIERAGDSIQIVDHRCSHNRLQLLKITGSSFAHFVSDAYTTLPQQIDRPLFIYLDVYWKYVEYSHMIEETPSQYIPAEQVRDVIQATFHRFVSKSIQHLVYEMATELLKAFPQMEEVSFVAQNRLWDTAYVAEVNPKQKVYIDPRPPYGMIKLTLSRRAGASDPRHQEDSVWQADLQPTYLT